MKPDWTTRLRITRSWLQLFREELATTDQRFPTDLSEFEENRHVIAESLRAQIKDLEADELEALSALEMEGENG